MAGRSRIYLVAALVLAAPVVYFAASSDPAKPADKSKKKAAAAAVPSTPAAPASAPAALDPMKPAATIGDKTITIQELAMKLLSQQEFENQKQALDNMVNDTLLEKEAAVKGVAKDKLIETEVTSKLADPAAAEIDAWYEQNKARVNGQTKEQLTPQIAAMLKGQKAGEAQRAYLAGLRQRYAAKIVLEPPRFDVPLDDDASKGPAKAPITIVEFSDYQCPYCSRAEGTVQDVLKKYGDKIRLVYRDYPLSFHQNAQVAAEASECAKDQGKFWEMHSAMFANQAKLAEADLIETAGGLGLDKDKFKSCIDSGKKKEEVQKDFQDGVKFGVTGTPTFFVNGIRMVGARDVASFSEIIDHELQPKN